jgi:LAS seventeen-binding protein 5
MSAVEMYDHILAHGHGESTDELAKKLSETQITMPSEESLRSVNNSQSSGRDNSNAYSDLQDLNFGSIGGSSNNLPPPIRPSSASGAVERDTYDNRGSLSDFSDYESSDEESHNAAGRSEGRRKDYVNVSDNDEEVDLFNNKGPKAPLAQTVDKDPFADPFADEVTVGPNKKW